MSALYLYQGEFTKPIKQFLGGKALVEDLPQNILREGGTTKEIQRNPMSGFFFLRLLIAFFLGVCHYGEPKNTTQILSEKAL
jgi:hypothetical protein